MTIIFLIITIFFLTFIIASFSSSLGIGGGIFTVPLLMYASKIVNFPHDSIPFVAITNSLLLTFIFSFFATIVNIYHNQIEFKIGINFLVGSIPGSFAGVYLSQFLEAKQITSFFGFMVLIIGIYSFLKSYNIKFIKLKQQSPIYPNTLKFSKIIIITGIITGLISSLTGIGGGIIMVPLFSYYLRHKNYYTSIGTSTFCMFIITISSSLSYLTIHKTSLPEPSIGYYYLPFTIPLILGAIPGGFFGARIKNKIPDKFLRRTLSILQIFIGLKTLWR